MSKNIKVVNIQKIFEIRDIMTTLKYEIWEREGITKSEYVLAREIKA